MIYLNFTLDCNSVFEILHSLQFRKSYLSSMLKSVDSSDFPYFSKILDCINSLISDFDKALSLVGENKEAL